MNTKITTMITLFLMLFSAYANRVVVENYGMTNRVNAMVFDTKGYLWLATPGGLVHYNYDESKLISQFSEPDDFPDIHLTALTFDDNGDLWIGTESGTLYRRDRRGNQEAFHDLELSGSSINTLLYHRGLLYVGHRQGISIFEEKSLSYRGTAVQFGNLAGKPIVDIKIKNDTLYAVYEQSSSEVVRFADVSKNALTIAFSTPISWNVLLIAGDTTEVPLINSIQFDADRGILGFPGYSLVDTGNYYVYNKDSTLLRGYYEIDTVLTDTGDAIVDSFHVTEEKSLPTIRTLQSRGDGVIVTGHEWDSFYKRPLKAEGRKWFNGLRKNDLQKLFLQSDGTLWTIPNVSSKGGELQGKNELITIKNDEYDYFGDWRSGFGTMGRSDVFKAVAEGPDGAMWFGTSGDFTKRFKDGKWQRLIHDKKEPYTEKPFWVSDNKNYNGEYGFAKTEGLFVDSANTLWSTVWHNSDMDGRPMFFVYNPSTEQYRYWGEMSQTEKSPYYIVEGSFNNKLFTFRWHKEDGFGDNYTLINGDVDIFDSTQTFESLVVDQGLCGGLIHDVAASDTGSFVFATTGGVEARYYHQADQNPLKHRDSSDNARSLALGQKYLVSEEVALNDSVTETRQVVQTDLWVGVKDSGVVLYYLKEYWNPDAPHKMDKISIVKDSAFSMILEKERLLASSPNSMVYDREGDHLWVASSQGLSKLYIQRDTKPLENNEEFYLYPNPYRKSQHTLVTLKNVAKDAYVDVYTSSGQLVEHITSKSDDFVEKDENGVFFYKWSPSSKLSPGTYFVVAKNEERSSVVLQKLLILP